jgi:hypothetical protein
VSESNGTARPVRPPAGSGEFPKSGRVFFRTLTLGDLRRVGAVQDDKASPPVERLAAMVALVVCGPDGRPLPDDGHLDVAAEECGDIVAAALAANGQGADAVAREKKGSPPTPGSSSFSPSASPPGAGGGPRPTSPTT